MARAPTTSGEKALAGEDPASLSIRLIDASGRVAGSVAFAGPDSARASESKGWRIDLPDGAALVAEGDRVPEPSALLSEMMEALSKRDMLERDIASMAESSAQMLEQVSTLGETLPRLSAPETDEEIAAVGLQAALGATGAERAAYVRFLPETGNCEVIAYAYLDPGGQGAVAQRPPCAEGSFEPDGLIARILGAGEEAVLVEVPEGQRLGKPGSVESLAERELLGVPVSYGAGEDRAVIGALLLMDSAKTGWNTRAAMGSVECQAALSFAAMVGAVLGARKTASLGKEVSMAQAIQAQILPERPIVVRGFDLAGDYRTCGDVGGDYFDFIGLGDGRTMVVIADVSGHNLASGMVMVSARATLCALAPKFEDPALLFDELEASIYRDLTRFERFITAASVTLRDGSRRVEIVNAGHNPLLWYHAADRTVQVLPSEDTILGFLPGSRHRERVIDVEPGDVLLLYTDGITEAIGRNGEMFGENRLISSLVGLADRDAAGILAGVFEEVSRFRGEGSRDDDMTATVIRALPEGDDA